ARVFPLSMEKFILSTARTMPSGVLNDTERSVTSNMLMIVLSSPVAGVERVAQAVADEVEAEQGDNEEEQREQQLPQRAIHHRSGALADQRTPGGQRFLHAQPQERDEALGEDHLRHQ